MGGPGQVQPTERGASGQRVSLPARGGRSRQAPHICGSFLTACGKRVPLGTVPAGPLPGPRQRPSDPLRELALGLQHSPPRLQRGGAQRRVPDDWWPTARGGAGPAPWLLPASGLSSCLAGVAPAPSSRPAWPCAPGGSGPWACSMAHSFTLMASSSCQQDPTLSPEAG